jgi:hypothetical protein
VLAIVEQGKMPISSRTWDGLVAANHRAHSTGWAEKGVFGTGIGPDYKPGGILWVGKSAGPLGSAVGSTHSQAESVAASTRWMVQRENRRSAFWQMAEMLDPTRRSLAWTNLSKMDRVGGGIPPKSGEWASIAEECKAALTEEIENLRPGIIVLATSSNYAKDVANVLTQLQFTRSLVELNDGLTSIYRNGGSYLVSTKHPQGWAAEARNRVVELVKSLHASARTGDLK